MHRKWIALAALFGMSAVGAGALGAHALKGRLEPGDLICFNRRVRRNGRWVWTTHSYDSLRRQYWLNGNQNRRPGGSSHTSLVVGTERRNGRDFVQPVGGNEGNSVRLQRIPVNAGGGIDNPAARHIFGAIKITRC